MQSSRGVLWSGRASLVGRWQLAVGSWRPGTADPVSPANRQPTRTPFAPHPRVQKEIPRADWQTFFESFTMQHDRWLVSVDGERETMPLEGIVARDTNVVVTLGGDISHHRRITIDAARVRVEQEDGVDRGLDIESADGHTTKLRFRLDG